MYGPNFYGSDVNSLNQQLSSESVVERIHTGLATERFETGLSHPLVKKH